MNPVKENVNTDKYQNNIMQRLASTKKQLYPMSYDYAPKKSSANNENVPLPQSSYSKVDNQRKSNIFTRYNIITNQYQAYKS